MISIDRQTVGRTDEIVGWKKWVAGALCAVGLVASATAAEAQTRTLKLLNVHTGEKAEIVYRRGSSYDSSGMKKANYILRDWRKNQPTKMNPKVLDVLWEVYRNTGASGYIHVICGYRSAGTNSMLRSRSKGVAKKSQHMLGNAIDYYIPGVKLKTLRNTGLALQAGGVGYYPSSGSPFVHMDVGKVRHWGPISESEVVAALRTGKRMGKSGVTMAAFADDSKRSPGLLARLFGGGADEEEDNAESGTVAATPKAAKPAKVEPKKPVVAEPVKPAEVLVAEAPKPRIKIVPPDQATPAQIPFQTAPVEAVPAAPEPEVVETPETILASLPARKVPKPLFAPRPEADVGPVEAETASATQVAELIEKPETALPAKGDVTAAASLAEQVDAAGADVPADQKITVVPEPKPTEVALGIPLPTWRPKHQPEQVDATALLALASLPEQGNAASDAIAGAIVPTARPDAIAGTTTAEMTGAIPAQTAAKPARVAVAAPVRTTRKSARPSRLDSKPDPKPVVLAAAPQDARWAIDKNYVTKSTTGTKAPSYAHNIVRTAPLEVYTAGFQTGGDEGDINRFSGKAVKFLQVARFQSK